MIRRIVVIRETEYELYLHTRLQSMLGVLLHHQHGQTDEILVGATPQGTALNHATLHMAYQARF
jgi:hypothetical protein